MGGNPGRRRVRAIMGNLAALHHQCLDMLRPRAKRLDDEPPLEHGTITRERGQILDRHFQRRAASGIDQGALPPTASTQAVASPCRTMAAAVATLSELAMPCMGMVTAASARSSTACETPARSEPSTRQTG